MVRLLRHSLATYVSGGTCFNPTMVRLLLVGRLIAGIVKWAFQSHNGAIAAVMCHIVCHGCVTVSIPQWCDCCLFALWIYSATTIVSIPQWCECCRQVKAHAETKIVVSIPQWCDCCNAIVFPKTSTIGSFNPTMVRLLPRQNFGV